jgi:hypothetical protein
MAYSMMRTFFSATNHMQRSADDICRTQIVCTCPPAAVPVYELPALSGSRPSASPTVDGVVLEVLHVGAIDNGVLGCDRCRDVAVASDRS